MRLVTFRANGGSRVGALTDDGVIDLTHSARLRELEQGRSPAPLHARVDGVLEDPEGLHWAADTLEFARARLARDRSWGNALVALEQVRFLPPVVRPTKVLGVGLNYLPFLAASGDAPSPYPILFHKTCSALVGCGEEIVVPRVTRQAVPEGELAVIVGRRARGVAPAAIGEHIAGYACANDVSARDLEFRTSQWSSGKMLETFCPLGPALVTRDEVPNPSSLRIETRLNGEVVQDGRTSDMVFGIAELVAEISSLVTLEPGDVILTGTPSDLGLAAPPVYLRDGDRIAVSIDGLGRLENRVRVAGRDGAPA